jgi:hypothetical protein
MKIPWSEVEKANLVWKGFEPSCQKGPCAWDDFCIAILG